MVSNESSRRCAAWLAMAVFVVGGLGCSSRRSPRVPKGETRASTVRVHRLPHYPAHENRDVRGHCEDDKIAFIRANGCWNGGSVEFCIPNDDAHAANAVRDVAPGVGCAPNSEGHAGCDPSRESRCVLPTIEGACEAPQGAMTHEMWGKICGLSRIDAVTRIVPSFEASGGESESTDSAVPSAPRRSRR